MIAAFSITPMGAGESVSDLVAEAVRIVRASGLPNETNAMFTNVEGSWEEVMALIKDCVERLSASAPRLSVVVKVDYRPSAGVGELTAKVGRVEARLGHGEHGS
ncbi:MAG: MTH1187 family thiamine-binding protein [Acidimicrobiales bacterium]